MVYLETKRIVHGDLHANNIFVDPNGFIKVADNGLLTMYKNCYYKSVLDGETRYLAPELLPKLARKDLQYPYSWKQDVFTFGMTLLSAASLIDLTPVYVNESIDLNALNGVIADLRTRYSATFIDTVIQMLNINPAQRLAWGELNQILERFRSNQIQKPQPQPQPQVVVPPVPTPVQGYASQKPVGYPAGIPQPAINNKNYYTAEQEQPVLYKSNYLPQGTMSYQNYQEIEKPQQQIVVPQPQNIAPQQYPVQQQLPPQQLPPQNIKVSGFAPGQYPIPVDQQRISSYEGLSQQRFYEQPQQRVIEAPQQPPIESRFFEEQQWNGQQRAFEPQPRIVDQGRFLDGQSRFIDQQGRFFEPQPRLIDQQGRLIDPQGRLLDQQPVLLEQPQPQSRILEQPQSRFIEQQQPRVLEQQQPRILEQPPQNRILEQPQQPQTFFLDSNGRIIDRPPQNLNVSWVQQQPQNLPQQGFYPNTVFHPQVPLMQNQNFAQYGGPQNVEFRNEERINEQEGWNSGNDLDRRIQDALKASEETLKRNQEYLLRTNGNDF